MSTTTLELGSVSVDVIHKDIKNIHLSVHPPTGRVRISAPHKTNIESIRLFAISKLSWIKTQQRKLQAQEREPEREYLERESHYLWGKRYLLRIEERESAPTVSLTHRQIELGIRPGSSQDKKKEVLAAWYRHEINNAINPLILKWEKTLDVKINKVFIKRMKTKWGSCNPKTGNIFLNTELAKKPLEYLEYILVHEMMHLIEPTHNERFQNLMTQCLPKWKNLRAELNQLPISDEWWD